MKNGQVIKITLEFEVEVIQVSKVNDIEDVKSELLLTVKDLFSGDDDEFSPFLTELQVDPVIPSDNDEYDIYNITSINIKE